MDKKYKKQNSYNNFKGSNNSKQNPRRNRSAEPNTTKNDNKNSNKSNNRGRSLSRKRNFQGNRSRSPSATRPKMLKILSEKYNEIDRSQLIELENLDSENIIIFFSKNHLALGKLLKTDDFNIIVLFLRVTTKLCLSNFNENKTKIIKKITESNFLQMLQNETASLAFQDKRDMNEYIFYWADQNRFWNDVFQLYETIFNILPKTGCRILPKLIISHKNTLNNINIKEIIVNFDELQTKIKNYVHQQHSFRNMNVLPSVEEVTKRENPYLQSLKQDYSSVEEYLDIHFRLLREDYVQSVRTGVCNYLENQKYKQSDVRIYENVKFVRPHIVHDRVGILVNSGFKTNKDDMKETKRFQHGTLVCFSKDKFREIVYATIFRQTNDENLVTDGYMVVDIHNPIIYDYNYVMIETKVTFETYFQVLQGLQNLKPENFPMKKYIIDCEKRMERPEYLDEKCQIKLDKPYVFKNKNYFEFSMNSFWPPKEYFSLNTSQYTAFKTALTSKFSVIHGPPGTGKTYTTLKIVEFLLKNKPNLQYLGPILVICYSNHALDQFLEGILPFCGDILRIKNQKSSKMDNFDLRNHRKQIENDRDSYCRELLEQEKIKVDQCVQKLQCLQNLLEDINSNTGIIDFEYFKKIDKKIINSWFDRASNKDIIEWLIGETDSITVQKTFVNQMSEINICYCKASTDDRKTVLINANNEYNSNKNFINNCILKLSDVKAQVKNLENEFVELKRNERSRRDQFLLNKHEQEILRLAKEEMYLQEQLNRPQPSLIPSLNYSNPYNICKIDRWALYHYWVHLLQQRAYKDIAILDEEYRAAKRRYLEVQNMVDIRIMQEKSVIGMTTHAAAKHQPTLQTLKCEIVIVEEAAEILESHVVASLTNHCQQLILIGDHLQLRPSTQQFNLARNYNLEISLFERMVRNNIHYTQLQVQHRMRPEFAKLISPSIYPNLINDESVLYYPPVRGMAKNLYFIAHNELENQTRNNPSKRNIYEAKYLLKLVSYLIKQGYTANEITVLTSYKSQKNALEKECTSFSELENVRIETVDNFQGEENKIILLSLVRSNEKEDIGFLKVENRVCVLLSRAKEGFYMIGNVDNFEKSSLIWPKVIEVLKKDNSIGPCLTLKCLRHTNETRINNLNDFDKVSDGGCTLYCNKNLSCGHLCKYRCHPNDRNGKHVQYTCKEPCKKVICNNGHECPLLCSEPCKACEYISEKCLPCGHFAKISCSTDPWDHKCTETRIASLQCGHSITIECYKNSNDVKCMRVCEKRLNCGHSCKRECHNDDPQHKLSICRTPTNKQFINCSHTITLPCNTNIGNRNCVQECGKRMSCQHICKDKCCHAPPCKCNEKRDKIIEACGHTARVKCSVTPRQQFCYKRCQQILECGHRCNRKCNETCACPRQCVPENESDLQCCIIL